MSRRAPGRGSRRSRADQAGSAPSGTNTGRAVVLVAVAVVIAVVLLSRLGSPAASTSTGPKAAATTTTSLPRTTTTTTTATPPLPPAQVKVQVLNGVLTGSLSSEWSAKLKTSPGYDTLPAENATQVVTSSAIYIVTNGFLAEADALAKAVGLPTTAIVTSVPPPSSAPIPPAVLGEANLVLVIGPNLVASA
jgi:hypothetical protein